MKTLWFKRKTYGYGWTPATWQGWVIVVTYIVLVGLIANRGKFYTDRADVLGGIVIPIVLLTAALIATSVLKGERPRWQWGKKKE